MVRSNRQRRRRSQVRPERCSGKRVDRSVNETLKEFANGASFSPNPFRYPLKRLQIPDAKALGSRTLSESLFLAFYCFPGPCPELEFANACGVGFESLRMLRFGDRNLYRSDEKKNKNEKSAVAIFSGPLSALVTSSSTLSKSYRRGSLTALPVHSGRDRDARSCRGNQAPHYLRS